MAATVLREKRVFYELLISQLRDDGLHEAATIISRELQCVPMKDQYRENLLYGLSSLGKCFQRQQPEEAKRLLDTAIAAADEGEFNPVIMKKKTIAGIDFEEEYVRSVQGDELRKPDKPDLKRFYTSIHSGACGKATFSADGSMFATGSIDMTVQLVDMNHAKQPSAVRPLIRTLQDHERPITDIDFFKHAPLVASSSMDKSIKFFDIRSSAARSFRFLHDTHIVRSINIHPSGDFLISATDHPVVRIWDIEKKRCYVPNDSLSHHFGAINQVRYSHDGQFFVTASTDGFVRIWDSVSSKCERLIAKAHNGREVCSAVFSRNDKYLLTNGRDDVVRLWDIGSGRQVREYKGASQGVTPQQACFSYNEDFVVAVNDHRNSLVLWDTRSTAVVNTLEAHSRTVNWVASSPVEDAFVTCSDDNSAKLWLRDPNSAPSMPFAHPSGLMPSGHPGSSLLPHSVLPSSSTSASSTSNSKNQKKNKRSRT
mmetsp:Transcript_9922/g.30533  ORF Transcript_9922/g.30533 Transcript_9922/m.30533 type:complete len:483 (-) Transcript_9922:46-1494(-)